MTKLEELSERLKNTYMDEEQQVTLSMFCDENWNEVNSDDIINTEDNIINILQHYVDTGGSVAGGYIHCVPNIIKFVENHYNFFLAVHIQLKSKGLYKMDLLEFLLTQYREYIFQTSND
jgi:hypothetical protein